MALRDVSARGHGVGVVLMAMDDVQAATRRDAVYGWLDRVEGLVVTADEPSLVTLAQVELVRLCQMTRKVLAAHHGDHGGRCSQCSGWFRPVAFPCLVWTIAHEVLIADEVSVGDHRADDRDAHWRRGRHAL